jgi:hypothetical protein
MAYYELDPYYDTLTFGDVFSSSTEFISKVVSIGGISTQASLEDIYERMAEKYLFSHTRYATEDPFILAIKRELRVAFPYYLERVSITDKMIALTDAEIELRNNQLRNLVDTHDDPIANADTVAFDDLSTQQENININIGKLIALKEKYNAMNRDYLTDIYRKCDPLFRQILAKETITVFESEE